MLLVSMFIDCKPCHTPHKYKCSSKTNDHIWGSYCGHFEPSQWLDWTWNRLIWWVVEYRALNYWMMVERYPNLKEEVGSSIPGCEISSLLLDKFKNKNGDTKAIGGQMLGSLLFKHLHKSSNSSVRGWVVLPLILFH